MKQAILYVDKDDPCDELKKQLTSISITFEEWKVDKKSVNFTLPLLITAIGVFTGSELMRYGPDLRALLK